MAKILFSQRSENYKNILGKEIENLSIFFKKEFNIELFLIFGTLLGAIREKDFIAHDTDIDMGYISKFTTKDEVNKEFDLICDVLQSKNLFIRRRGHKHFDCKSINKIYYFDIWVSYINKNGDFRLAPFHVPFIKTDFLPLKSILFRQTLVNIPQNPELILDKLYKNWQTPLSTNFRNFKY